MGTPVDTVATKLSSSFLKLKLVLRQFYELPPLITIVLMVNFLRAAILFLLLWSGLDPSTF